jgi:hypothetical protein
MKGNTMTKLRIKATYYREAKHNLSERKHGCGRDSRYVKKRATKELRRNSKQLINEYVNDVHKPRKEIQ